jgi:recombination protein RecR
MAQANYPEPVTTLVDALKHLPGIGSRSAERIALWLLQNPKAQPENLREALRVALERIVSCPVCGFFATVEACPICSDPKRDPSALCVVEQATDILPIERSRAFSGSYHCLGGKLSPLDHVTPEDLRIGELIRRIEERDGMEIILAVGADVEGEATANFLADLLRPLSCQVTRLAQGLPAGGDLEHADQLTVLRAFDGRR